ncbi:MAG: ABC transporter ATP-binding protein [Burkholderiaceae bacterium]|nr:ABC transporter ATP-binding protein [Burkholderiaceae bacterium]
MAAPVEGAGRAKGVALAAEAVTLRFGGVVALSEVSVDVRDDELLAVIGPNGAGKTSLMNCLSGFYRPQQGRILLGGRDISGAPVHRIARHGVARTFQGTHIFSGMTVVENIMVGRHIHMRSTLPASFVWFGPSRAEEIRHREIVEEIIEFLEIETIRHRTVGSLGYGLRKRVDLGRALAQEPRILLMDEPMAGMNVEEKEDLARFILDVREARRLPVVLVEHDMGVVMDLAERIVVLDFGRRIAEGTPHEIQRDPAVLKAYLGEGDR